MDPCIPIELMRGWSVSYWLVFHRDCYWGLLLEDICAVDKHSTDYVWWGVGMECREFALGIVLLLWIMPSDVVRLVQWLQCAQCKSSNLVLQQPWDTRSNLAALPDLVNSPQHYAMRCLSVGVCCQIQHLTAQLPMKLCEWKQTMSELLNTIFPSIVESLPEECSRTWAKPSVCIKETNIMRPLSF